ncbi:MAG: hypothetical protein AAGB51_13585 [Planctomycetota bacterium]
MSVSLDLAIPLSIPAGSNGEGVINALTQGGPITSVAAGDGVIYVFKDGQVLCVFTNGINDVGRPVPGSQTAQPTTVPNSLEANVSKDAACDAELNT